MIDEVVRSTPSIAPMRSVSSSISPMLGHHAQRHQVERAADRMQRAHLRHRMQRAHDRRHLPRQHRDHDVGADVAAFGLVVDAHRVAGDRRPAAPAARSGSARWCATASAGARTPRSDARAFSRSSGQQLLVGGAERHCVGPLSANRRNMACYFGKSPLSIDDSIRIIEAFRRLQLRETPMSHHRPPGAAARPHRRPPHHRPGRRHRRPLRRHATRNSVEAIDAAVAEHARVRVEFPELLDLDEAEQAQRRPGRLRQFLLRRHRQSVRRAGRARAVGRHPQRRRAARLRRLRHARFRPHAEGTCWRRWPSRR